MGLSATLASASGTTAFAVVGYATCSSLLLVINKLAVHLLPLASTPRARGSWIVDESPRRDNLAVPRYRTIYRAEGGRALTSPVVVGHVLILFG